MTTMTIDFHRELEERLEAQTHEAVPCDPILPFHHQSASTQPMTESHLCGAHTHMVKNRSTVSPLDHRHGNVVSPIVRFRIPHAPYPNHMTSQQPGPVLI
ncbi:hypothetical protein T265_04736 [Opisthorchis viverrini]|uniref:Uncharacterized protein n=1 Tax=Opisthorchis viverrini TaxID=6198 RepID=A0A074ZYL7_OPIVI|nr:hypothetical protein T265_04736 [Opisthorchis viverrini]KER28425.1 hypothetical protein T265_04736 [Opisthorchis viverrini]